MGDAGPRLRLPLNDAPLTSEPFTPVTPAWLPGIICVWGDGERAHVPTGAHTTVFMN